MVGQQGDSLGAPVLSTDITVLAPGIYRLVFVGRHWARVNQRAKIVERTLSTFGVEVLDRQGTGGAPSGHSRRTDGRSGRPHRYAAPCDQAMRRGELR